MITKLGQLVHIEKSTRLRLIKQSGDFEKYHVILKNCHNTVILGLQYEIWTGGSLKDTNYFQNNLKVNRCHDQSNPL